MKTELFIARRLGIPGRDSFSRPIVKISITAVSIGIAVMLISVSILTGFRKEIREKVTGFSGHIQITRFTESESMEPPPIASDQPFLQTILLMEGVSHIQPFATKPGIIKSGDNIQGVVLKGVTNDYDWGFLRSRLREGTIPDLSDSIRSSGVLISQMLADLLDLRTGDDLRMYFISETGTPGRKFRISGIFNSGFEEFDKLYVFGDMRQITRLNNWEPGQVGGFEVLLKDFRHIRELDREIYSLIGFDLNSRSAIDQYPQIFDWLELQDINVWIILVLMALVAGITMISTLLILIIERTSDIGILKSLGMTNGSIMRIFILHALKIIGYGLMWGNIAGLTLCFLQKTTGFIRLPEETYYVAVVPVHFDMTNILLINAGTVLICLLFLIAPALIITRIMPVRAIRFS